MIKMSCVHKEHAAKINIFLENNAFWQKIQQKNTICNVILLTVGAITAAYTLYNRFLFLKGRSYFRN